MSRPCLVCQADNSAFLCKPCLSHVRETLTGRRDHTAIGLQALRHELSMLATGQTFGYYSRGGTADVDDELAELDEEYAWRRARTPAHLRTSSGRITLPSTATVINLHARDLLTEADNTIVTWARALHEDARLDWTLDTVAEVITWLSDPDNADRIRWHQAADEIHDQLDDLHRRMLRTVDRTTSRIYAGPCEADIADGQKCRAQLYTWPPPRFDDDAERARWEDANPIQCDGYRPPFTDPTQPWHAGCGQTHHRDDRRVWLLADIEDRLLPLSLLQDALPGIASHLVWPKRSTWWKWTRETETGHRLLHPRTVIDGVEFYRGGDVVDLVTRQQKRIIGNTENHRTRKTRTA